MRHPGPNQFTKHLGNIGRGNEITGGAKRLPRNIIAVNRMHQRLSHVVGQRQRSGQGNPSVQDIGKAIHGSAAHDTRRRRVMIMTASPMTIIGSDSNCPMVAPANRKPRWASG